MKMTRRRFLILGLIAGTALVVGLSSFLFMLWKDRTYFASKPYVRKGDGPARVLVVYYSRSGHTEAMAREIARHYQADILRLVAPAYSLDLEGWNRARRDAAGQVAADISPKSADLTPYDLVFVGSPIWLYRPAPPLWSFVEGTDFQSKDVVLFNTFNSRFKLSRIAEFRLRVTGRGGNLRDHVFIRRGRIYAQISGAELIRRLRRLLAAKAADWPVPPPPTPPKAG